MIPSPIFIVGSYRSGTSVLAWCLGQHPNIVNLPETHWIAQAACEVDHLYELGTVNGRHSHLGQIGLSLDSFRALYAKAMNDMVYSTNTALISRTESGKKRGEYRRRRSEGDPKQRWVDATPENSHHMIELSNLFSHARFVHLVRRPSSVAWSLMNFANAGGKPRSRNAAYRDWLRLVNAVNHAEATLGSDRCMRVFHEDLVADPKSVLAAILSFAGETDCEDCILPLQRRINSSSVPLPKQGQPEYRELMGGKDAKRAEALYAEMRSSRLR